MFVVSFLRISKRSAVMIHCTSVLNSVKMVYSLTCKQDTVYLTPLNLRRLSKSKQNKTLVRLYKREVELPKLIENKT